MGMRGTRGGTPTKPKHTEESIQQALYWNHPILTKPAFEMVGFIFYAWESDYLAISKAGYVYECEIKISHSDFLNEAAHKQEKMRLLGGEDMTVAKYHGFNQLGIEYGKEPMQKPVPLLERLIEIFTDKGDVVIDPCAGSGTTLLAAANMGRKAYGFEIKKDFCAEARVKVLPRISKSLFV